MKKSKKTIISLVVLFVLLFGLYNVLSNYKLLQTPINILRFNVNISDFSGSYTYEELIENVKEKTKGRLLININEK